MLHNPDEVSEWDVWRELERLDVWGEWVNARQHPHIARVLTHGYQLPTGETRELGDYTDSVSALRAGRRETPSESAEFWRSAISRAHLLNAVLRRGDRALVQVERELDLRANKLHSYFQSFGIRITARLTKEAVVIDADGSTYEAEITEHLNDPPGDALLRVPGFPAAGVRGRWSPHSRAYRLLDPLPQPQGIIPLPDAASLLLVEPSTISRALDLAGIRCNGRVYLHHLTRMFTDTGWLEAAKDVYEQELDAA